MVTFGEKLETSLSTHTHSKPVNNISVGETKYLKFGAES